MNKNLDFYVKTYKLLNKRTCKKVINEIENIDWMQHEYYQASNNSSSPMNGDKELDVGYIQTSARNLVMNKIWESYFKYLEDLNFSWFNRWQGFTEVRFNRYKETKLMSEHCDHIHSMFDGERKGVPILTALGLLNDEYEGGELVFFGDTVSTFKVGEIKVFPSCFLFPHRIEPVTEGTRYSFVSWAW